MAELINDRIDYEKRRDERARFDALTDTEKAALLRQRIGFEAEKLLAACASTSPTAAERRTRSIINIAVFAIAEGELLDVEASREATTVDLPTQFSHVRARVREFVDDHPRLRRPLLETALFDPAKEQDLSYLIFPSIQGGRDEPSAFAADVLAGEVAISV